MAAASNHHHHRAHHYDHHNFHHHRGDDYHHNDYVTIPHICHQYHQYICGEKSVMWSNFKFTHMTEVERS